VNNLLATGLAALSNLNLASIFGGRVAIDFAAIFADFVNSVKPAITGLGQHFLNQGLSAVLGGLTGGRIFGDLLSSLSAQISTYVALGQQALSGIIGNVTTIASSVLDASKPHWEGLQEQLVGHGLNVLSTLGNTINDLHGSVVGGR